MTRDDHRHRSSQSDSATGSSARVAGGVTPKTARTDNLAAIMRDSTIILETRMHPVAKVHVQRTIQPAGTVPPADRGEVADRGDAS